jgi:hypothetical protein
LAGTLETPAYPQARQCRPPHPSSAANDAQPAAASDALFFSFTVEKEFVSIVVEVIAEMSERISR